MGRATGGPHIPGLPLLELRRITGGLRVPGRMVGVLMRRGLAHLADQRVLGVMAAVLLDLVHNLTVHAD